MDMRMDSRRIRAERTQRAWSQEHLAHITDLGLRTRMNRLRTTLHLAILLVAVPQFALEAEPAAAESARSFLLRMQEEAAAPIIQHCVATFPELRTFLAADYASFKDKFRTASAGILEESVDSAELAKPIAPEIVADFVKVQQRMLADIRKLDPKSYCTQLRSNLANQTVATIRIALEGAFRQYTSQEQGKPP